MKLYKQKESTKRKMEKSETKMRIQNLEHTSLQRVEHTPLS
jgi:hypothetical protein